MTLARSAFLSPDDVRRLTGCNDPGQQAHQLGAMRIKHWINAQGEPVVPRNVIYHPPLGGAAEGDGGDAARA